MNYYNPYFMYPYVNATSAVTKTGLLSRLFKGNINFTSILNGTQRVLNITNQALPLIKQAGPIVKNAKTMFKVMNEFSKSDIPKQTTIIQNSTPLKTISEPISKPTTKETNVTSKPSNTNNLTFFQ